MARTQLQAENPSFELKHTGRRPKKFLARVAYLMVCFWNCFWKNHRLFLKAHYLLLQMEADYKNVEADCGPQGASAARASEPAPPSEAEKYVDPEETENNDEDDEAAANTLATIANTDPRSAATAEPAGKPEGGAVRVATSRFSCSDR